MSLLPCLLVLFLSIHGPASLGAPAPLPPTYDGSMCAREPVLCGGVAIHYPFYLSNATRETPDHASYSCGYADLNISCQSNGRTWTPTIRLGGHSYTVQSIFYNNQSFILVDTDLLSGGGCPLVSHNVTFDETWLHNTSSNNLSFFYGCFSRNNAPPGFDAEKYRIQCPGFNSPFGGVYSFMFAPQELNRSMEDDLAAGRCNQTVSVPVRSESLMGSDPAVLRRDGYGDVLQKGFELGWSRKKTDQCYMCELSTGKCAYSGKDLVGCLCDGGKVDSQECKNSGARNASPPRGPWP